MKLQRQNANCSFLFSNVSPHTRPAFQASAAAAGFSRAWGSAGRRNGKINGEIKLWRMKAWKAWAALQQSFNSSCPVGEYLSPTRIIPILQFWFAFWVTFGLRLARIGAIIICWWDDENGFLFSLGGRGGDPWECPRPAPVTPFNPYPAFYLNFQDHLFSRWFIFKIIFKPLAGMEANPEPFHQTQLQLRGLELPEAVPNLSWGFWELHRALGTSPGHKQQPKCD